MSRIHTFFIEDKSVAEGKEISLTDEKVLHQIVKVFRLGDGDEINLINDTGFVFRSTILSLSKRQARIRVTQSFVGKDAVSILVTLIPSLIKKDNLEWVIEKGTELGVTSFVPLISKHSEKKAINQDRLKMIAKEATEQCGRSRLPYIGSSQTLEEVLMSVSKSIIAFDGSGEKYIARNMQEQYLGEELVVLIGPEGGWSDEERQLFREKKVPLYSLGERTLRAETAAIVAASLLLV